MKQSNQKNSKNRFSLLLLEAIILFDFSLIPANVHAQENDSIASDFGNIAMAMEANWDDEDYMNAPKDYFVDQNKSLYLPGIKDNIVQKPVFKNTFQPTGWHTVTAYNSLPGQTDNSPCITANGFNVCTHGIEDTVAANFLKFGTKVRMPDIFGDRVFVVRDRMNARFSDRMDVWMINYADAKAFGKKHTRIEIVVEE